MLAMYSTCAPWRGQRVRVRLRLGLGLGVHLGAGQLAALARLGALGHLDLDLLGGHEVRRRDAEATRGDLLHLGDGDVAVAQAAQVREGGRVARLVRVGDGRPARLGGSRAWVRDRVRVWVRAWVRDRVWVRVRVRVSPG